jgi:hypothetical protein
MPEALLATGLVDFARQDFVPLDFVRDFAMLPQPPELQGMSQSENVCAISR